MSAGCASSGWPPIPLMNGIWSRAGDVPLSPAWRHLRCARLAGRVNLGRERQFDTGVAWRSRSASGGCLRCAPSASRAPAWTGASSPGRRSSTRGSTRYGRGAYSRPRPPPNAACRSCAAASGTRGRGRTGGGRDPGGRPGRGAARYRAGRGVPAEPAADPNLPPFLFYRGTLGEADTWSVAVVGTRNAAVAGLGARGTAIRPAREPPRHGHLRPGPGHRHGRPRATLDRGGRTIAVGTGITRCYPAENRSLADQIAQAGIVVSQFWPTRAPGRDTFPRRNVVTSGLSQGTVVIEASQTSGAKMQARLALEHGKKVFLVSTLVTDQAWARDYVARRGRSPSAAWTRSSRTWPRPSGSGRRHARTSSSP